MKSDKGMKEEETLKPAPLQDTFGGFDTSAIEAQEEAIGRQYASKGLKIHLFMKTSVVNKKVDVFLRFVIAFVICGSHTKPCKGNCLGKKEMTNICFILHIVPVPRLRAANS